MANAFSLLIGKKLAAEDSKKSCKIKVNDVVGAQEAEVTIKFVIPATQVEVGAPDVLAKKDFARAVLALSDGNLSPAANEIRTSVTTEKEAIFLNVSIQLTGVKGKHA